MTNKLLQLGFKRYKAVSPDVSTSFQSQSGCLLPKAYLEFLGFSEPDEMFLTFPFVRSNVPWNGCITEFNNIAPHADGVEQLASQVIRPTAFPGRSFLPIGDDPGGNWLCFEFVGHEARVVDLDFATGAVSVVATDFESFVELLVAAVE